MRNLILALPLLLAISLGHAREYGAYDPKRLLLVSETPAGTQRSFDVAYLDRMLGDLASHAKNYPPQFDTPQDRQRAIQDVRMLSGMLDILIDVPTPSPETLLRAGFLNSLGHNLDIAGSAGKTAAIFQRLLAALPEHPQGNYLYGTFLAGAGKPREALPHLEKAFAAGVAAADYAIGMTHLTLGDKAKALEYLEAYKRRHPQDANADRLIDAVRNGKIEIGKNPRPP